MKATGIEHVLAAAAAFLACTTLAGAQQMKVLDTYPAHPGKDLTMGDAVLGRHVYPENRYYHWKNAGEYEYWEGKDLRSGFVPGKKALSSKALPYTAFTEGNSLYVTDRTDTVAVAVSNDRELVYGQSVSRNEFGIGEGWYFSPSGMKLAFYRKDESRITDFPLLDITTRTGSPVMIKYPMNGMDSEIVRLGVYDIASGKTIYLNVTDFTQERYLTNISWSPDEKTIYVQVLDRSQSEMHLNAYSAATGNFIRTVLTEENPAWVEPLDHIDFVKGGGGQFIYRTDNRDGYKNLYLVDTLGTAVRRLTCVDADVEYIGNDGKWVYYTSAEVSPIENHLFRTRIDGKRKPENLTPERGWHHVSVNEDFTYFIDRCSSFSTPAVTLLRSTDGKTVSTLTVAPDPLERYNVPEVRLGTVPSADGAFDNYFRLILPAGFDPAKKYPVVVYVYGGPHDQLVRDTYLGEIRMWEMLMAQKGYIVYVQDNRGTPNRGAAYEKAINRQCGVAEMEDQMVGIGLLKEMPFVDSSRIGVHGWSYGGFMTISLMTTYPETFKVGVAGGPVIDWKWYEIMYGERYMDNPRTNPEGFAKTSLIGKAPNLRGKLLICQGAVDNTCVWEHSLSFVQACIEAGIPVDYFPYPLAEHNVRGEHRIHLMDKVTAYFEDYL